MKKQNWILVVAIAFIVISILYIESTQNKINEALEEDTVEEAIIRAEELKVDNKNKTDEEIESEVEKNENLVENEVDQIELVQNGYPSEDDLIRIEGKVEKFPRAKELVEPGRFINSEELAISENIGKNIVLIDFWTYSCINCQRTLPYVNSWYEEYSGKGLVILGVHTPEFDFEKDYENVVSATEKYNVEYPIVQDNDYKTWRAYENRYWPRKYLIDIDGFIVYDHIGEGAYEETENKIIQLLTERNEVLSNNLENA